MMDYFSFTLFWSQQAQNSEEPFPTTSEDLAGFWDMVMLQVEHVNRLFEEIRTLRAADWVEVNSNLGFFTLFCFIVFLNTDWF
jgi:hypothetical protein